MANQASRLVLIYKGNVATGTVVAAVRTKSITINREPIDVTNDDSDAWRTLLATIGSRSVDISVEGVVELTDDTFIVDAMAETLDLYTVAWTDGRTIAATFQLGSYEESGSNDGELTYSASLASSGVVTYTAAV